MAGIDASHDAIEQLRALRRAAHDRAGARATPALVAAVAAFDRAALSAVSALAGGRSLTQHLGALEFADMAPNDNLVSVLRDTCAKAAAALGRYQEVATTSLADLNRALAAAGLATVAAPTAPVGSGCGR